MNEDFSLEALSSFGDNFKSMAAYLKSFFKRIGVGSSRLVFLMDDNKVIKVAKNDNGLEQNEEEYSKGLSKTPIFAKVYDADEDNNWIIMEYAPKAKNNIVKSIYGTSFDTISDCISLIFNSVSSKEKIYIEVEPKSQKLYDDFIKWLRDEPTNSVNFTDKLGYFMKDILDYLKDNRMRKADVMDWFIIDNWGIADRNGELHLVIIDMGLNTDMF